MIIHKYSDGSEGFEYEKGDHVEVLTTTHKGWFDVGVVGNDSCYVEDIEKDKDHFTACLSIRYSKDWGCAKCFRWHLNPKPETYNNAKIVIVEY